MGYRAAVVLVGLGCVVPLGAADPPDPPAARKDAWQKYLDGLKYSPPGQHDGVVPSLSQYTGDCKVHMTYDPKRPWALSFQFERDGKDLVKVEGHAESVFRTEGDVLYFADFPTSTTGCTVLAYDLTTGKRRWAAKLKAVGDVSHFAYQNRVTLHVGRMDGADPAGEGFVEVTGRESYGDYIEVLDRRTGQRLAHRVYREGFAPEK